MKTVYIACRVGGDVKKNLEAARLYYEYAVQKGVAPVMPHLILADGILDDSDPEQRRKGIEIGESILLKCDALWVVIDSRGVSAGMQNEINIAAAAGIPIDLIQAYPGRDDVFFFE